MCDVMQVFFAQSAQNILRGFFTKHPRNCAKNRKMGEHKMWHIFLRGRSRVSQGEERRRGEGEGLSKNDLKLFVSFMIDPYAGKVSVIDAGLNIVKMCVATNKSSFIFSKLAFVGYDNKCMQWG